MCGVCGGGVGIQVCELKTVKKGLSSMVRVKMVVVVVAVAVVGLIVVV